MLGDAAHLPAPQPNNAAIVHLQGRPVLRGAADNWQLTEWNPAQSDPFEPAMPDLGLDFVIVLAGNANGAMGRSDSFTDRTIQWEKQ